MSIKSNIINFILDIDIDSILQENEKLKNSLKEAKATNASKNLQIENLNKQVKELKEALASENEKVCKTENTLKKRNTELSEKEGRIKILKFCEKTLNERIEDLKTKSANKESELSNLNSQLEDKSKEIISLKSEIKDLKSENDSLLDKYEDINHKYEELKNSATTSNADKSTSDHPTPLKVDTTPQDDNDNEKTEGSEHKKTNLDKEHTTTIDVSKISPTEDNFDEDNAFKDDSTETFYDTSFIPAKKLSIPEVYDTKENKIIDSKQFLSQHENELINYRRSIQEDYEAGHVRFICPECKQPVKLSGHKLARGRVCFFAHFKDSENCPYKTGTNRSKEEIERQKYSLVQESERHKYLKSAISSALEGETSKAMGVKNVECEKTIKSDIPYLKWRRPDIYAEYNGHKFVFELQLSTTFISVIVERDIFYRLNKYDIIWVFNFEDNGQYVNLSNLMCKDIYYANKRNIFIFDKEAKEESEEKGQLVLKCRWLDENGMWSPEKYVTLDMLQYDEENHKPFIYDADKAFLQKHPELIENRKRFEHTSEELFNGLMEHQKREEEQRQKDDDERTKLQRDLFNSNEIVELYQRGTKYGYKYKDKTIIPAKYTSAEDICEDGYAKVGFNRKLGLVRRDGKEIVPTEYKEINVINSIHGVIMASYKQIDLWLGDEKFNLAEVFDEKEQTIISKKENHKTTYILQTNKYTYTKDYNNPYPVRHKVLDGKTESVLFIIFMHNGFCVIKFMNKSFLLSRNRLSPIQNNYTDFLALGYNQLFIAKDSDSGLYGICNFDGIATANFQYAKLIPTGSEYIMVKKEIGSTTYGLIDYMGREFIKSEYEDLIYLGSGRFAIYKDSLWSICDYTGYIVKKNIEFPITSTKYIRASSFDQDYANWEYEDNVLSYSDNNKTYLIDEYGKIIYSEQNIGIYHVRHSEGLYSILSLNDKEIINYSLSYIKFISDENAIIRNKENVIGFFTKGACKFFNECKDIEHLKNDLFKFENFAGNIALGNYSGTLCDYSYSDIKTIDECHFVASKKIQTNETPSVNYIIINEKGKEISFEFSEIGIFNNGIANAIYKGHKGCIDINGIMQEEIVKDYGDYTLYEKFGISYFRNKVTNAETDKFQAVNHIFKEFFIVKRSDESNIRLFSLKLNKATNKSFYGITHLVDNLFVAEIQLDEDIYYSSYEYLLYKGIEPLLSNSYSAINMLDNGYIAFQNKIYGSSEKKWLISTKDGNFISNKQYDKIIEANKNFFKVSIDGHEGLIDMNGNTIVEKEPYENHLVLTHCFADNGLEDSEGNVILPLEGHFSDIKIIENNIIKVCKDDKYALYTTKGEKITEYRFSSVTFESNNRYAIVENDIKGHIDSRGNYVASSSSSITEDGTAIIVIMNKYGLSDFQGNIIIPAEYRLIKHLKKQNLLVVIREDRKRALFDITGKSLTKFIYSDITCNEDGSIQATRNNIAGILDENGNEIPEKISFDGGYIQNIFGEYSVKNDTQETNIYTGYSKIELLDKEQGIFALWKNDMIAIGNTAGKKTKFIYNSVKPIGRGFFFVSRLFEITRRNRYNGYNWHSKIKRYGILDKSLRTIIQCNYKSISDFDNEWSLKILNANNKSKTISLSQLTQKASNLLELSIGTEYDVEIKAFMAIGVIIKIKNQTIIIHKKYLFKKEEEFKKGESFTAKFIGYDEKEYPIWETHTPND